MIRKTIVLASLFVTTALVSCNQSDAQQSQVPEVAHNREDIEMIVRAYILENPEIISDALDVLQDREYSLVSDHLASNESDFSIGPDDAPVTIVEFFDYKCGYCRMSVDWVIEQAEANTGNVRIVLKELPILSAQSRMGARAAIAAMEQDNFLEFHQKLMKFPGEINEDSIAQIAGDAGLNSVKLLSDMEDPSIDRHLERVLLEARDLGVTGTPAFVINGKLIEGGFNRRAIEQRISDILEG